jgi:glycine/D-amino acid oxidase-like deaminating enzyme
MIYGSKPHIAHFELETYRYLENLVEQYGIPCDWKRVGGVHTIPTDELVDLVARSIANINSFHPQLKNCATLWTDPESIAKFRVTPDARGVVHQPWAAKCWPYKLVTWVLEALFTNEPTEVFNLQTTTPVTHLQQTEGSNKWIVHTPRGQVLANDVLLATNAYTSHLLPKLSNLVVPVRGQVAALEPPDGGVALEHSHVWLSQKSDNYLVQRNDELEMIVVGGERTNVAGGGEGVWRDDKIDEELAERLRRSLRPALKLRPWGEKEEEELKARYEWTGIMGYTTDGHPFVGEVPEELGGGRGGLWVSAGYNGHGMPVAARCAVAVSEMILGRTESERTVKLPEEFVLTVERAERIRGGKLVSSALEEFTAAMKEILETTDVN